MGRDLGLSRQKVNYHLRALEDAGLVEHVEDRRRGNCTERIVRATNIRKFGNQAVERMIAIEIAVRSRGVSSDQRVVVVAFGSAGEHVLARGLIVAVANETLLGAVIDHR